MYQDRVVLCGASSYEKKYYLNEDFKALPQQIQDELKIMCVLFTEDIGGVLTLVFDEEAVYVGAAVMGQYILDTLCKE